MSKSSSDLLFENYPDLLDQKEQLELVISTIVNAYKDSKKVIIAGNGGSSADADHIVGELMKGFKKKRPISGDILKKITEDPNEFTADYLHKLQMPLRAISLSAPNALLSAFGNDVDEKYAMSQALLGYADEGDVFIAISTSGNSYNVCAAASLAVSLGLTVVALTGQGDSKLSQIADVTLKSPSNETYRVQEYHLPIYHAICLEVENHFYPE